MDRATLEVYAARAGEYAETFARPEPDRHLTAFMDALPAHATVLDLGCGPGRASAAMRDAGFDVHSSDASPAMAGVARETYGLNVRKHCPCVGPMWMRRLSYRP